MYFVNSILQFLKRVCLINVTFFVIVGIVDLKKKQ